MKCPVRISVCESTAVSILDRSQLISDQSGHLFSDWLRESSLPVNHWWVKFHISQWLRIEERVGVKEGEGGREQRGRE